VYPSITVLCFQGDNTWQSNEDGTLTIRDIGAEDTVLVSSTSTYTEFIVPSIGVIVRHNLRLVDLISG